MSALASGFSYVRLSECTFTPRNLEQACERFPPDPATMGLRSKHLRENRCKGLDLFGRYCMLMLRPAMRAAIFLDSSIGRASGC